MGGVSGADWLPVPDEQEYEEAWQKHSALYGYESQYDFTAGWYAAAVAARHWTPTEQQEVGQLAHAHAEAVAENSYEAQHIANAFIAGWDALKKRKIPRPAPNGGEVVAGQRDTALEDERAAFEKVAFRFGLSLERSYRKYGLTDFYEDDATEIAFQVWQARAALAAQAQDAEPTLWKLLRKNHLTGEWMDDANERWGTGSPPQELVESVAKHPEIYKFRYAYEHPPSAQAAAPTDAEIQAIFDMLPDGPHGFLKNWGFLQFARKLLERYGSAQADADRRDAKT